MLQGWFQYFDYHGNERLSKSELLRGIVKTYDAPCQRMLSHVEPTSILAAQKFIAIEANL